MKHQIEHNGIVTLTEPGKAMIENSSLFNDDLRPTTSEEHHWTTYNFCTLWMGMAICLPAYAMAAGMITLGMNWWQAVLTVFLGTVIVLIPILLNAHAGAKYGIPYAVYSRLWFGAKGAHIPTLARGIISAGWFGINSWLGGSGIDVGLSAVSGWGNIPGHTFYAFFIFLLLNVAVAYRGPESVRVLVKWVGPLLAVLFLVLLIWALVTAGGVGPILAEPSKFASAGDFFKVFFPSLTGVVAFWATVALNIPDFSRHAKTQKSQILGQSLGLPLSMAFISFIGIAVASATVVIFGEAIWDPVQILTKFPPFFVILGTIGVILASLTINVGANVIAPARAFENINPKKFTFGMGVIVTGLLGILMQPWYLMANFGNYIFGWLGTYGALLGPLDGIAIADYWLVRRTHLSLTELYLYDSRYNYAGGFNKKAIYAFIIGVAITLLGLVIPPLHFLWANALVFGFFAAMISYTYLMKNDKSILAAEEYHSITEQVVTTGPVRGGETSLAK